MPPHGASGVSALFASVNPRPGPHGSLGVGFAAGVAVDTGRPPRPAVRGVGAEQEVIEGRSPASRLPTVFACSAQKSVTSAAPGMTRADRVGPGPVGSACEMRRPAFSG